MAEQGAPGEPSERELLEQLEEQVRRLKVSDVLVQTIYTISSLGYRRLAAEERDLEQARLAVEALRALVPVLEGSVPAEMIRDFNQATANMQLAYAKAAAERPVRESGPVEAAERPVRDSGSGEGVSGEPGGSPASQRQPDQRQPDQEDAEPVKPGGSAASQSQQDQSQPDEREPNQEAAEAEEPEGHTETQSRPDEATEGDAGG